MDTQGRRNIDPADQWVLDPETGTYQLRLEPETPPSQSVPAQGGRGERRRQQETQRPPRQRRSPEDDGDKTAPGGRVARREARPKKSKNKKALIWTAGAVGLVLVVASGGGYLLYEHFNNNINTVDIGDVGNKNATFDGPMNILVIGTDSREGLGTKYGDANSVGHADTTILFHVSKDRTNATAMSIPRDLVTGIPNCPTKQKDGSTKVVPGAPQGSFGPKFNVSLGQQGRDPGCTMRTVTKLTGLTVDHFMMVNFEAVKTLSAAVNGVPICLTHSIDDTAADGTGSHLHLSAGPHRVQGEDALKFVRTRHSLRNGSDLDRIKLQQQFLGSMIREMKSQNTITNPSKLFKLANAATKALTVDTGIGSVKKLSDLAQDLIKVDAKHITFTTLPVKDNPAEGEKHATVVVDEATAQPLFEMLKNDVSLTEVAKQKKQATDAKLHGPKAAAADVRVKVFNGSGTSGAAQATVGWLQNDKGATRSTNGGNAPAQAPKTTLVYAPNQADQARALADMMGLSASALHPGTTDADPTANMTLTLGADFKGAGISLAAPTKAPADIQRAEADKGTCVG
ncbi:LCP family protein [Streptomyces sp. NBC_00820]|uniref:LCP family protein n=1 Tax=Streptomyces sp. NBC_00820 TaxID=2975842 RepID=UPI002ED07C42|nr:LCP family protein [Streptomyces sp. NBC_00820]